MSVAPAPDVEAGLGGLRLGRPAASSAAGAVGSRGAGARDSAWGAAALPSEPTLRWLRLLPGVGERHVVFARRSFVGVNLTKASAAERPVLAAVVMPERVVASRAHRQRGDFGSPPALISGGDSPDSLRPPPSPETVPLPSGDAFLPG